MTQERVWEDMVALNVRSDVELDPIEPPSAYAVDTLPARFASLKDTFRSFLDRDIYPLPSTQTREGYYGSDHFSYWLSGALDFTKCMEIARANNVQVDTYLDLGSATGRVARHFACQLPQSTVYAVDINLEHVRWVNRHFGGRMISFQNTSIPHLPLESNSVDLVTAYSVFSHIEAFDHAWLMEIRRILRPGGMFILTANVDSWQDMNENWHVYKSLKNHKEFDATKLGAPLWNPRVVFRWNSEGSYSSVVFLRRDYVDREWGNIFEIVGVQKYFTPFQTGVYLRKRSPAV